MKIILFILCFWGFSQNTFAQLTGTKTIGTGGTYTTFALAVTDLNTQGVGTAGVTFEFIDNGGGNFAETISTSQIITTTTGTSANQITFRPATSITTATLTVTTAIIAVDLNGADYLNFDGRNGGTGSNKNLIFVSTNTANPVFQFRNGASNNDIVNTKIQSRNTGTTSGAVVFGASITGANTLNTIDNSEISGDGTGFPVNGIYSSGSASPNNNTSNTISNCFIYDYFNAGSATNGVFLSSNNTDWTITSNRFYQTISRNYTATTVHRAIQITTGGNYTINNNVIGFASSGETGTYTMSPTALTNIQLRCMSLTFSTGTSTIRGNRMSDIIVSNTNSPNAFTGIEVLGGNANIGGTGTGEGNTIGNNTTTGNINITSTSNTGGITGILVTSGGTPTVNIQGNKVGSITANGVAPAVSNIIGIQSNSGGNITNNIVGSATVANSINNVTTVTANNITVYGIFINNYTGSNNLSINDNIVANINNQHAGTSTTSLTRGIYSTGSITGNLTINNNQIFNISTNATQNGTGYNNAVLGGITCNSAALITITNNQVYNLSQAGGTLATQIYGIFPNISNSVANTVSRNLIYNLSSTSTGAAAIYGLRMAGVGSTANICANNVVRLGQGITAAHILYGLYDLAGTSSYYYNSVYIMGTIASGSARSFCIANDATNIRIIQNNIFVNVRDNATSGVNKHYAYFSATSGTLTSDYNIMFANGVDGFAVGRGSSSASTITNYGTFKNYRVAFPTLEVNSAFGNPQLSNPTATTPDLSLALLSPAYQTGTPIAGITVDYANVTRNTSTPNIGAYETSSSTANATTDIFTPVITYTNLTTPYNLTTGTRTLTATIKDNGIGVPISGGNVPRLYYRNISASGAWQNVAGTNTGGTGNNGTWDFVLDQVPLSLVSGQTIAYYVVAQDQATTPNIWYNGLDATILHSDVNTQTTAPTTPNTYIISGTMGGSYNVPGQFTSLTKTGGIFQAINNATGISSNITINITADLDEDATNALSAWADGGNNYTLTIQPDASTLRTIQNSANILPVNTAMIRINTAVSTTINGNFSNAGQFLLFRNTNSVTNNTGSTISIANTVSKLCTIQNVTVENNMNFGTAGNIAILAGTNNVNINNCNIGDATAGLATGSTRKGIYEATGTGNIINIQNNNIYNFQDNGIVLNSCASGAVISGNKFYKNITTNPNNTTVIAILINGNHTVSNNVIGGSASDNSGSYLFETSSTFTGIQIQGTNAPNTISGNTIQNISLTTGAGNDPKFIGVTTGSLSQATITGLTINTISIPTATGANMSIEGLRLNANPASVSNSTFSNMSMGVNNAGFFHVVNCLGLVTYNISNCTINNITSRTTGTSVPTTASGFTGITTFSGATLNVTGCTLSNMASNGGSELRAIFQNTGSATGTYTRNRIFGLTSTSGQIMGISANNGDFNTSHNQITITNGAGTNNLTITGIYENTSSIKSGNHYFNTIYIGGTQTGGSVTSHCYRRDANNSVVNLRNNLFINERTSPTGNHFVISATTSTFTTTWTSNYNLYVKGAGGTNFIASSGVSSATTYATYSAWKTAQTGEGNNSWNAITGATSDFQTLNPSNLFVDLANGNLNINPANQELWFVNGKGTQIAGFADDFATTNVRSVAVANGGTDIGSDEINANTGVAPILANATGTFANNGVVNFVFAGRQIGTLTWGGSGTVPTGLNVWYYSGSRPLYPNPNAQFFNAYWRVEAVGTMGTTYNITLNYDNALVGTVATLANTKLSKRESAVTPPNNWLNNWITEQTLSSINVGTNSLSNSGFIYNSFSEFTGSQDVAPLPLQLLSFEAKRQNNTQNQLQWTTANEVDLKYFVIEKSQNGKDFTNVTQLDATNKSTQTKIYQYLDNETQSMYYRLKFVHTVSNDEYSMIRFVAGNEDTKVFVYPNPLQNEVNFEIPASLKTNNNISIKILNLENKVLGQYTGTWQEISTKLSQEHNNWQNGVYFWQITPQGEKTQVIKVVK